MLRNNIFQIANLFFAAFHRIDKCDAPGFLPHFPEGCCNWASRMVGHYLKFECGVDSKEIQADRDNADGKDSHAWLVAEGVIIDLTCNQYPDCQDIIIAEKSSWHAAWTIQNRLEIRQITFYDQAFQSRAVKPSDIYERLATLVRENSSSSRQTFESL